ncbi:5-azacytidine resistance azr1 [Pyrenophora seminiperda CCB06]|uniref:5-azacytidine resistance azr1 n=1 Tax=Pyrenophora seminiperda CCB06 TaxID=1302712 RepID=A0A3M7LWI0_9PLEO|nr:5-azacytidine resistance azr1 [Pyrenophora seminiperda CCB06]
MNTRRPSTPKDAGSPRMSFASAEALLWGPEMKKQHAYLLTEMRTLQKQYESYDTRIQATETIADAAEAATTKLRHLEQKVAAMEAEDEDKAFEKWASGELARLNVFVDANKSVRQKQVELCTEVLRVTEDIDMLKGVPTDLKDVLRHLELLERGRREDALKIERLEREVIRLGNDKEVEERMGKERSGARSRQNRARLAVSPLGLVGDYSNSYSKPGRRTATPPRTLAADTSDSTTEPDDELMRLPRPCPTFSREQVQVPQSPANQMK